MDITAKVNVLKSPMGSLLGYASVIVDGVIEMTGFRIIKGPKGIFVAGPQTKGKPDAEGKDVYYDNIRFLDKSEEKPFSDTQNKISAIVIKTYEEQAGANMRESAASARAKPEPAQTRGRPGMSRSPSW